MSDRYKQAGVDVEAGYQSVEQMKKHVTRTLRPEVVGSLGAFAGIFDISKFDYEHPVLVTGTDGVGTKLKLAFEMGKHDTIGQDAVAMCVNDIVAQGADPLFFLDYIACGKNSPDQIEQIVKGIADGCEQSGCALIGGETAEMPGMYDPQEYDLAGFVVGIAEKSELITGEDVRAGDAIIGLSSSGVHSNGFSLVRKIIAEYNLDLQKAIPELSGSLGEVLLTPTRLYARQVKTMKQHAEIKGIAHITGGGFYENIPRALPDGFGVEIDRAAWKQPEVFPFLQEKGNLSDDEMYGVFNMGIGMIVIVSEAVREEVMERLEESGETAHHIGMVTAQEGVQWT
ncbi:phosphoribosylformylglycinamidine cyclo-ligase [Thalassobacillus cyri]|uniref:Phosphoribosylformylglycinamidine cyclo-ligase n=1 Tax=Thalassobacillus cyri TaxID=571932 RepID=A0A1H4EZD4_9BACI|nr:phosphoribosylformylglycinamidine cyclo-ligase [Thalassobacillus cyri]SEA90117.1 phosphoribosylformylglycinamidine cyclo-ligase [Thalassobacillus cyri]